MLTIIGVAIGSIFINEKLSKNASDGQVRVVEIVSDSQPVPEPSNLPEIIDFTAGFEIYTNGTKRIFNQDMYHNQSADVYLTSNNPSTIHIKKRGITWDDFFKTLPFSVTNNCLVTGTKQTFCTTVTQKLRFYLNEIENSDVLGLEIKEGDFLKIVY